MSQSNQRARRLLIVANRSPFTALEENGKLEFKESSGGLVSGLTAYLDQGRGPRAEGRDGSSKVLTSKDPQSAVRDPRLTHGSPLPYVWIGWPGGTISTKNKDAVKRVALDEYNSYPVFLSESEMEQFYQGFCNNTIWPLFHYFLVYTRYEQEYWEVYKKVNRRFCEAVLEILEPGDIVWVHDYQLMLLPQMLREAAPDTPIGYFHHIPFPSYEVFRLLPKAWARELLQGLLGADLVGFHTYDYTQYFLRSVLRMLGHEQRMGELLLGERVVKADTFPMGIDFDKFAGAVHDPKVAETRNALRAILGGATSILSIDRLDYSKGIINRLKGYEEFLDRNPDLRKKVVLALVVIPSRAGVPQYDETRELIEATVGRINGRFGSIDWTPIRYQYRSVPFPSLIALYSSSQIALVTPLRDGMNLIAKEYLAAREDEAGVLILSELAGAAKELGEAIIINPNSVEEIAEAIDEAIEMPLEEQKRRNRVMRERLRRYNVVQWAEEFICELEASEERQERYRARILGRGAREEIVEAYRRARHRIIFLDYDGTLMPFSKDPQAVTPEARVSTLLKKLASDPCNKVFIMSGRDRDTLSRWFGDLPLGLVAEHGVWVREVGGEWRMLQQLSNEWKGSIRPVLETYVDRLPGSFIEEKEFSLAWHYRAADPELSTVRASELTAYLTSYTANIDVQVMQGHKVIEVKSAGVNKGTAARHLVQEGNYEFVMGIGDDWTDEYLFSALPADAYSIRVGVTQTAARYHLLDPNAVRDFLEVVASGSC
jgi:trehalose 6-phosphate synthase/phosphatase